ncbi:MAG: Glu-tRNA(Gln) amidotransferase subunit GatE [Candidatus Micrarchaeota archaeon]|nr:Glu-tRNA(Gln) amidotransferase subunit GatE [Candidatus Micrarchaeota archaeon]
MILTKEKGHYSKIGFKCGLEIHQRLSTEHKLFCSCSARLTDNIPYTSIERSQRAVAGELGLVDRSTSFESSRDRTFVYNVFRESSCLVDIDEEPPHDVNPEAVGIALRIAASMDCRIPDEIEPMRKEVVDGSDPSAFQRSMIVGYGGTLDVGGRGIPISSIFLEEESSGIEDTKGNIAVYNVDRLGIPLIEIDTDPVIASPQEAKEVAMKIGLMLRLTGRAQRGIGSIRQDVNVSVSEGTRVEIKGLQDLSMMDEVIEHEVERQLKLIEIKKELAKRKTGFGNVVNLTSIFKGSKAKIVGDALQAGGVVMGMALKGFKGILGYEVDANRRLGSEISDYAKKAGVKGIIHSDEKLEGYGFTDSEIEDVSKELGLKEGDAFIMIAARKDICERAMAFARQRAEIAVEGVPPETRAANSKDPTTRFMRPLPGGSRMYPETDSKPIPVDAKMRKHADAGRIDIERITKELEDRIKNKQISDQMLWSPELQLFNMICDAHNGLNPQFVASVLVEKFKELKRSGIDIDAIDDGVIIYIFGKYADKSITKNAVEELLKAVPRSTAQVDKLIGSRLRRMDYESVKSLVKKLGLKDRGEITRRIMSEYRLVVDGEELGKAVEESLK